MPQALPAGPEPLPAHGRAASGRLAAGLGSSPARPRAPGAQRSGPVAVAGLSSPGPGRAGPPQGPLRRRPLPAPPPPQRRSRCW